MTTTIAKREKINDFGDKIGGAKKDLSNSLKQRLSMITDDTLTVQPLSKAFPRPDFQRLYRDGAITADTAIRLLYLYNNIPNKPRSGYYSITRWIAHVKPVLEFIRQALENNTPVEDQPFLTKESFLNFEKERKAANWPEENYNPHPYHISYPHQFSSTREILVCKGRYIKHRSYNLDDCIKWIKDNTGTGKPARKMQFSLYHNSYKKNYFITPKGKKGIRLKDFDNREEALAFYQNNHDELVKIYNDLRNIHQGRRDWNRPRVGVDHRHQSDITTGVFADKFPFRGVEFGNWVNQVERAANLNEAYDAFCDLMAVINGTPDDVTFDGTLAMAFGARGSGDAAAHYERVFKVFNLTKTRGAGNIAHEWFHGLDNFICALQGSSLSYATEAPADIHDEVLSSAIKELIRTIGQMDFKKRSEKIDEYKSKKYWSTDVELTARAFESYVIRKLKEQGHVNDYLANVMTLEEYPFPEVYPYPTEAEVTLLMPYYDNVIRCMFHSGVSVEFKETA